MDLQTFQKIVLESEKARFGDEIELTSAAQILACVQEREQIIFKLKFFSTPKNPQGFYGLKELSQIIASEIIHKAQSLAKQAKLKNFKGDEQSAFYILQEYFLRSELSGYPDFFVAFTRDFLSAQEIQGGKYA